ncbi:MAG TPA: transcriptional regulator [Thermomonas sp.]|jgi:mRNA-degrading endonuclease RelE of RelBE toxin-antitoxin system|uniref:transcriptional regulator n=1 Tax=Thermomonas sp. TaxID=1971895 RepID=UPI002D15C825|nr:transcriptional regulator [Thermomonas sp.]HOV97334.1 transcriptional regulator [Thermomonas sp.]
MFTVTETPMFIHYAANVWSEGEREEFVDFIAANPEVGDVIPEFAPLRKVRWSAQGKGKRGGVRVIYYTRPAAGKVNLLIVYPKSKTESLSQAFLRELRKLLE